MQNSLSNGADQRAAPRYPCKLSVELCGRGDRTLMETIDVSVTGMLISTDTLARIDERLQFRVFPISSQLGGGIEFSGYVRRVLDGSIPGTVPGLAVELFIEDEVAERRWKSLIDALVALADSAITKPIAVDPDPTHEMGGSSPSSWGPNELAETVEVYDEPTDEFPGYPSLSLTRSESGEILVEEDDSSLPQPAQVEPPIRFPLERVVPRGKIPLTARPRICVAAESLRSSRMLDQRRAFVLLYVDGKTSVEDIVDMVHFEFHDTIAMLISMVDDGILEW